MPGLLALDTSTHVGWAHFLSSLSKPRCGTWHAPAARQGNYGARFSAFRIWFAGMLDECTPKVVAFESPITRWSGRTSADVTRLLVGFVSHLEEMTSARGIRCLEFPGSSVKKRLTGYGAADKDHMVVWATRRGYAVGDHNQADAVGVALCAYDHINQRPQV